jgi:bile acid:Na+ symporter, BASS family
LENHKNSIHLVAHVIHRHFLALLLRVYAAAALVPAPGLWMRGVSFGTTSLAGKGLHCTLPLVMLAALLFNAGLGTQMSRLKDLVRRPLALVAGLAANLLLPLVMLLALSAALHFWHSHAEAQSLLVGLALVAAMPVAGSSAAWVQRADGDLPLTLGLVLGSTLLSPWTTPLTLHAVALFTDGTYADALHTLADAGTDTFLLAGVVIPSLAGALTQAMLGETRLARVRPHLKLGSTLALLMLCYANAAVALPHLVADPDWDFVAMLLVAVVALCVLTFAAGWALAWLLRCDPAQQAALVYGLGMSNNGTGLALAAAALGTYPRILLPLIAYNLVQHLVAGCANPRMKGAATAVDLSSDPRACRPAA